MVTHGQAIRGLVAVAAVVTATEAAPVQQTSQPVIDAVAAFARGEFSTAVNGLDPRMTFNRFTSGLESWVGSGDLAPVSRRRLVAAAFALDAVWAATRPMHDMSDVVRDLREDPERATLLSPASEGLVASWIVGQLPTIGASDSLERTFWLAAVGIAEDGCAWDALLHVILPVARMRLPDEPRLRLAEAIARTNHTLGPLRREQPPGHGILKEEGLLSGVTRRIPEAILVFEPLLGAPSIAGEAELRIGYLELRRARWPEALARFERAVATAGEPVLIAAAHYFSGWVLEQQGRQDDALAAYRRGHAITPLMRNLATRLSALLFLRNERAEAYLVLDGAVKARPAPQDLLVTVERADARFVPGWLASIRRALQ